MIKLLFICAQWHGLAKLRLHSDVTLDIMDDVTAELGTQFCVFSDKICPQFQTQELPHESAAHQRHQAKANHQSRVNTGINSNNPRQKNFNLNTYKYHSLGDYIATIRRLGTTDSYNTTTVYVLYSHCTATCNLIDLILGGA